MGVRIMTAFKWPETVTDAAQCECGRRHRIDTRHVIIEPDAHEHLPRLISKLGCRGETVLIADQNTYDALGAKVFALLSRIPRVDMNACVLKTGNGRKLHADIARVEQLDRELGKIGLSLGVGSGTINDIAKHFAHIRGIPYISLPTAPSMNGYTSSIAAFMVNGLKKTLPSTAAVAVVADLDTLCRSPMDMIRAGVGDSISKSVANADWKLAQLVKGEYFCRVPFEIVNESEARLFDSAAGIAARESEAISNLMQALIYSGISMAAAGTSAPASGGEHLIAHFLDMKADFEGRPTLLHGAQVGVAALTTSKLYGRIFEFDKNIIDSLLGEAKYPSRREQIDKIRSLWGNRSRQIEREYMKKYTPPVEVKNELTQLAYNWDDNIDSLKSYFMQGDRLRKVLEAAGAAVFYRDLGLKREQFVEAVLNARYIRARYTILDLAAGLGVLERFAEEL